MIFCDVLEDGGEEDRDSDYEEIDDSYINEEEVASIAHRLLNQKQMKAAVERPKTLIITENSVSRSTTPPEPPLPCPGSTLVNKPLPDSLQEQTPETVDAVTIRDVVIIEAIEGVVDQRPSRSYIDILEEVDMHRLGRSRVGIDDNQQSSKRIEPRDKSPAVVRSGYLDMNKPLIEQGSDPYLMPDDSTYVTKDNQTLSDAQSNQSEGVQKHGSEGEVSSDSKKVKPVPPDSPPPSESNSDEEDDYLKPIAQEIQNSPKLRPRASVRTPKVKTIYENWPATAPEPLVNKSNTSDSSDCEAPPALPQRNRPPKQQIIPPTLDPSSLNMERQISPTTSARNVHIQLTSKVSNSQPDLTADDHGEHYEGPDPGYVSPVRMRNPSKMLNTHDPAENSMQTYPGRGKSKKYKNNLEYVVLAIHIPQRLLPAPSTPTASVSKELSNKERLLSPPGEHSVGNSSQQTSNSPIIRKRSQRRSREKDRESVVFLPSQQTFSLKRSATKTGMPKSTPTSSDNEKRLSGSSRSECGTDCNNNTDKQRCELITNTNMNMNDKSKTSDTVRTQHDAGDDGCPSEIQEQRCSRAEEAQGEARGDADYEVRKLG